MPPMPSMLPVNAPSPPLIATSPPPLIPTPILQSVGSARRVHFDPSLTGGSAPVANAASGAVAAPSVSSNSLATQLGLVASPSYALPFDLLTPPACATRPYFTPQPQRPSFQPSLPMTSPAALPPMIAGPTPNVYASFMTPQMLPPTMPMHGRRPSPEFGAPFSPSTPAFSSMLGPLTASSLKIKDLSPNDVRSYTTKLERAGLSAWVGNLVYLMENKDPHLRYLLQLPLDQAQHAIDHNLDLQAANAYLARQIDSLLDPEAARVKVFKAMQVQDERIARSGVLKLAHIRRMCVLQNGAEVRHAQKAYDQRCFFKAGMSKDEVAARCYDLSIEFKTLPQFNGDESTMFEILLKMPDFMHFECDLMYKEVSKGQTLGVAAYTFDQFVECISTAFHHMTEAKGEVKSPGGLQTHGVEVSSKASHELRCVACGQAGHKAKECTKSCPKCHLKPCPGTVDASKCVVNTKADVPTTVKNALGSNIPEFIRQTLVNKNKAYRDSLGDDDRIAAVATDTELEVVEDYESPDDDEPFPHEANVVYARQRRANAAVATDTELEVVEAYECPDDDEPFPHEANVVVRDGQRSEGLFSRLADLIMLSVLLALVLTCVLVAEGLVARWRNGARAHRAVGEAHANMTTTSTSGAKLSFMLDGGSNSHIINIARERIELLGLETATGCGAISGFAAGSSMPMEGMLQANLCFNTHDRVALVDACYVPNARHNILSESALIDQGVEIVKKPSEQSMVLPSGAKVPLTRVNGLFYCDAWLKRSTARAAATIQIRTPPLGELLTTPAARRRRATAAHGQSPSPLMPSNEAKKARSSSAFTRLRTALRRVSNKAAQDIVDVMTDLDAARYRVPADKQEVANYPQRKEWMKADRKALAAILNVDNILVPIHKPLSLGIPISRTVAAQRIKVDPGTGRLASKNAFESRSNVDGRYLKHRAYHNYVRRLPHRMAMLRIRRRSLATKIGAIACVQKFLECMRHNFVS